MADADIKINVTSNAKQAQGELASLGGAAEDAGGKFGGMGAAAAAGATALVALGTKSVLAFEDLGLTVGKFSDATGVSAEEASRLIEVAGDLGIGSDQLTGAVIKMEKGLGAAGDGFAKYGIEAVKAKDGTTDVNATFAAAVEAINKIQDPLKRTQAQAEIFGKGFAGSAELTSMSAEKLKAALAGVEGAKIFDDSKVKQARDLRNAFDQVKDAGEDILLTIGAKLAPIVTKLAHTFAGLVKAADPLIDLLGDALAGVLEVVGPLLEGLVKIVGGLAKAISWLAGELFTMDEELSRQQKESQKTGDALKALAAEADGLGVSQETLKGWWDESGKSLDFLQEQLDKVKEATLGHTLSTEDAAKATEIYQERVQGVTAAAKKFDVAAANQERTMGLLTDATKDATAATDEMDAAYNRLIGHLDQKQAWEDAQVAIYTYAATLNDATASDQAKSDALDDVTRKLAEFVKGLSDMPAEQKTRIYTELDNGQLVLAEQAINDFVNKQRTIMIGTTITGGAPVIPRQGGYASGTSSASPGWHPVGENGPELVNFGGGEQVIPNNRLGGDTIIIQSGLDERRVTALLRRNARRGGRNPWG